MPVCEGVITGLQQLTLLTIQTGATPSDEHPHLDCDILRDLCLFQRNSPHLQHEFIIRTFDQDANVKEAAQISVVNVIL